jgi:chromosome segregation ATPase
MFRAIFRLFKIIGYYLTGRTDAVGETMARDPHVMKARYDDVIREKLARMGQYKEAVAGLIAQQEGKMATLKTLTADVGRLEALRQGATAKAKQRIAVLQKSGLAEDKIKADEEYQKCLAAYNDFSSTLKEKQDRIAELEGDVKVYGDKIKEHKVQLVSLKRDIEKIKSEAADAVADIISSRQEKELADMVSGISTEDTSEAELQKLRDTRAKARASARISKELAGTDTRAQEADFLEEARKSAASAEFEQMVGLSIPAAEPVQAEKGNEKLPE